MASSPDRGDGAPEHGKPHPVGVQIPRGVHSQVPQKGALRRTEAVPRGCVSQVGAAEGKPPEGLDDAALERSVFAGRLKSDAIKAGAGMRTHPRRAAPARRDAGAGAVAEGISIPDGYGYPLSFARNGPIFRWRQGRRYVTPANHRCAFTRRCSLHALRHL
jgi:hypothetical protein